MKTMPYFTLTLLIFMTLIGRQHTFAQDISPEYFVRVVYVIPRDQRPDPNIDTTLDTLIKDVQQVYAEAMERHGLGSKTFRIETNATGAVRVHRLNSEYDSGYYPHQVTFPFDEMQRKFGDGFSLNNCYVYVVETNDNGFGSVCGYGYGTGSVSPGQSLGAVIIPHSMFCDGTPIATILAHELGHGFGLVHDFSGYNNIMNYSHSPDELTQCHALWLDKSRYFNTIQENLNSNTQVETPQLSTAPPYGIRLQFEVSDPDGLYQAQLHAGSDSHIYGCQQLNGDRSTVEFVSTKLPAFYWVSDLLSVSLQVMDIYGNTAYFGFEVDISAYAPDVSAPVRIPDANLEAAVRESLRSRTNLWQTVPITVGWMQRIQQIWYVSDANGEPRRVTDLTGLEYAIHLRTLYLLESPIQDFRPIAGLTRLATLGFPYSQITDITPIAGLTQLKELDLGNNEISDVSPLAELTNLRKLTLWNNQIRDVRPLVGLVNLEILYLAGNSIEDFSPLRTLLANNPNLKIDIDIPFGFSANFIPDQTFIAGTDVSLTLPIAAGGTAPYTYSLSAIPAGIQFDRTTRVLSGTPTTVGTTNATYTATDATDASAALNFTIEVISEDVPADDPLDVNSDGQVTVIDLAIVALFYGTQVPADTSLPADVNADGIVNILDLTAVAQGIDAAGGGNGLSLQAVEAALLAAAEQAAGIEAIAEAPMGFGDQHQHTLSLRITYDNVADALVDVRHLATGDVRLGRGVTVLEELLQLLMEMSTIPETTALLPNYPNPFNPETWIPYQLAMPALVTLSIYSVDSRLVRTLAVGHQPAGVYRSKSRAAYWDGRNDEGELVASGLYFYTLRTDNFAATRKLIIRK